MISALTIPRTLAFSLIALLLAAPLAAQAGGDSIITISTTRTARIAPDEAVLFVTVEGTAETSSAALARAESKLTTVLEALRGPRFAWA